MGEGSVSYDELLNSFNELFESKLKIIEDDINHYNEELEVISNIGTVIRKVDDSTQKVIDSQGEQLTNIVKYLFDLAKEQNIKERQLSLSFNPSYLLNHPLS